MSLDGKIDWRGGLLEAARRASSASLRHELQKTLQAGVDPAAVKDFVADHRAVFGAFLGDVAAVFDDVDTARRASSRLLDQTQPRLPASSLSSASGRAQRPHAVRLDPSSSLPWHQRVSLPPLPPAFATGAPADVFVQGERFSPRDVAAMLAGC